jgi:hypothetical protein
MPTIMGTRVNHPGGRAGLDFTAIIGWNDVAETSGDYAVEVHAWEHDDHGDDDLRTAGTGSVPEDERVIWTVRLSWPFLFRFQQVLMPMQVRFLIGEPGNDEYSWNTELGDEEVYLRVRLIDRATNLVVDTTRTRISTGDW